METDLPMEQGVLNEKARLVDNRRKLKKAGSSSLGSPTIPVCQLGQNPKIWWGVFFEEI
ncbi:MAG: hypothetical protein LBV12_07800 [Puniceicoccales bacterium]|jgi:hypothetical protein|nr:hypothetical protein [Puniceicoccales bacterium]